MVLQLFYNKMSPPSRMAHMALKALGLECELKSIDVIKGENKAPEFLAMNARGKIPVLKDGDYVLCESRAIAAYLCNKYEKTDGESLYPKEAEARGTVDQLLYVSENIDEMILSYVNMGGVLFRGENYNEDKITEVQKALALCEGYLRKTNFMAANHLTLADFFMVSPILLLSFPGYNDFEAYPKTAAWLEKIKALPYFNEVNEEGLTMFKGFYTSKLAERKNLRH